jgi:hypothetical protein
VSKRVLLAAPRSFCAGVDRAIVARFRLAPVGETMFPLRDPFFKVRLGPRAAVIAACAEKRERGNLTVSPLALSLDRAAEFFA